MACNAHANSQNTTMASHQGEQIWTRMAADALPRLGTAKMWKHKVIVMSENKIYSEAAKIRASWDKQETLARRCLAIEKQRSLAALFIEPVVCRETQKPAKLAKTTAA